MARPLGHIRILMSARVLLDLEKADQIFKEKGPEEYTRYLCAEGRYKRAFDPDIGGRRLDKGPMWGFAQAALKLNEAAGQPVVEIGMYCKDDQHSALPIFRNIDLSGLDIEYRFATIGKDLIKQDHDAFSTDLLLTRNADDSQFAVNHGIASATIHIPDDGYQYERNGDPIQIWVDGDAVAFGSASEVRYRTEGLEVYREMEGKEFNQPIEPGPFTAILAKISQLNQRFPKGQQPFEISLLTARGREAAARVFTIAEHHGMHFNGRMLFMGGSSKYEPLLAHRPDLFLDDQLVHLQKAAKHCPTGMVSYAEGSPMHALVEKQKADAQAKERQAGKLSEISEAGKDIAESGPKPQVSGGNAPKCRKPGNGPQPK